LLGYDEKRHDTYSRAIWASIDEWIEVHALPVDYEETENEKGEEVEVEKKDKEIG
jgi:hypothetical protein